MKYEEALAFAVEGGRVRCDTMPPGGYVEHLFSRGFVRCWPVDRVEDEPNRSQCDLKPTDAEVEAEWYEVERPKEDSWGKPVGLSFYVALAAERAAAEPERGPRRSAWGRQTTEAATIAARQKVGDAWGKPVPEPVEFCGVCDFAKSACKCEPNVANEDVPKKEFQFTKDEALAELAKLANEGRVKTPSQGWGQAPKKEPNKWGI